MLAEPFNSLSMPFVALASKPEELALMSSRSAVQRHGEPFSDVSHGGVTVQRGGFARHRADWDQHAWEWDHVRFEAQPVARGLAVDNNHGESGGTASYEDSGGHGDTGEVQGQASNLFDAGSREPRIEQEFLSPRDSLSPEASGGLDLKLGGSSFSGAGDEGGAGSRSIKRYRPSSPGVQFPTCQVDDCKADLRLSKDYHRRHKVCEPHSKASKALVAHQLQRFCQQCSRFHTLAEFDEGKRSCRRRLAGHNRRRRKTQPDAAAAQAYLLAETDYSAGKAGSLLSFIHLLSQLQASSTLDGLNGLSRLVNNKDALLQYYKRACMPGMSEDSNLDLLPPQMNGHANGSSGEGSMPISTPHPTQNGHASLAEKQLFSSAFAGPVQEKLSMLLQSSLNGQQSQQRDLFSQAAPREGSSASLSLAPAGPDSAEQPAPTLTEKSNGRHVRSPPECAGADGMAQPSSRLTMSSQSAEGFAAVSQGWSKPTPVAHKLFPLQSSNESRVGKNGTQGGDIASRAALSLMEGQAGPSQAAEGSQFLRTTRDAQQPSGQKTSENSTSGSDLSPEGSNADSQDLIRRHYSQETLVGRISIKLFDKMPGDLPQLLRTQILEWLAHTPSDMESYIRPGCVLLTIFLCMPAHAWEELCRGLPWRLQGLLEASSSDFWSKGRIGVQVEGQTIHIVDGKVQLHSVLKPLCPPHVRSIRPIAIVKDEKTRLVLRGYNLNSRTSVIYSFQGKFGFSFLEPEEAEMGKEGEDRHPLELCESFSFNCGPFHSYGRCFIEVERSASKGNSLPLLVADSAVCAEIRTLEDEIEDVAAQAARVAESSGLMPDEVSEFSSTARMAVEAEVTRFLLELGWLMQRWNSNEAPGGTLSWSGSGSSRIESLLVFSVERDWCAVVKVLLDLHFCVPDESVDTSMEWSSLMSSSAFAGGKSLLHRAVKRNCSSMAELLLAYAPKLPVNRAGSSDVHHAQVSIFTPDMADNRGITPLHIAASMRNAQAMVDALTSDPGQRGIHAWSNARDASGQTPLNCAIAGGMFPYIQLVRGKVARLQSHTMLRLPNVVGMHPVDLAGQQGQQIDGGRAEMKLSSRVGGRSSQCGLAGLGRAHMGVVRGQAHRPFLLCMVAAACVCVVVCVLFKTPPFVSFVDPPFTWGALGHGPK